MKQVRGTDVWVNLTTRHVSQSKKALLDAEIVEALAFLKTYPVNKPLTDEVHSKIALVINSDVCLSPIFFFEKDARPAKLVVLEMVTQTELGAQMWQALREAEAFKFVDRQSAQNQSSYTSEIARILAVFALCTIGAEDFADFPLPAIHTIVDWFRTDKGMRWRGDLWGANDYSLQCMREIVLGLSRIRNDRMLEAKAGQARGYAQKDTVTKRAWATMCTSDDPLDRELTRRYADYDQHATDKPHARQQMVRDIRSYFYTLGETRALSEALREKERKPTFVDFLIQRLGKVTPYVRSHASRARRFFEFIIGQLEEENPGFVFYPPVTQRDLDHLKNDEESGPRKRRTTASRPLPGKLHAIAKAILDEGEAGWPGQSGYFDEEVQIGDTRQRLYCPVIPTLLRTMMDLPVRMGQLRRLDSGEGDIEMFNGDTLKWERNRSPLASYWKRKERHRCGPKNPLVKSRGYAYRFEDVVPNFTGFWMNTSKSSDPYAIPWEHSESHKRLFDLRKWQERYNPINEAIYPDQYLDNPDNYPTATKERFPDIIPLARLFPTLTRPWPGRIPTGSEIDKAWQMLMVEVERRWNLENRDDQISIVRYQETTGQPQGSIYNIHGMRVRGLSDLRRGGMPLDLLSKFIAGHASLMMTLYYMDFDPAFINESMSQAAVVAKAKEVDDFISDFKALSYEQALQRSVAIHSEAIAEAVDSPSKIEFCNVDIGLCPFDGTRCGDGGPKSRSDKRSNGSSFDRHGAVEPRNCIMCRHFVSGPPWILQLELFGTKLCAKRQDLARREVAINDEAALLREQRSAGVITRAEERTKLGERQVALIAIKDEQERLETAIFNVEVLLTASIEILAKANRDTTNGIALVGSDRRSVVEYVEVPEFVRALVLGRAAAIHPVLGDDRIKAMRDQRIDFIMHNAGEVPVGLRIDLTDRQREDARDLFSQFMLGRLQAAEIEALGEGRQRLQDLRIADEVKTIMGRALQDAVPIGVRGNESSLKSLTSGETR